jgi:hypothetical protein
MPETHSDYERGERYAAAVRVLQTYIRRTEDGIFHLNVPTGESIGLDPVVFADLKASLEETNRKILNHELDPKSIEFPR